MRRADPAIWSIDRMWRLSAASREQQQSAALLDTVIEANLEELG